MNTEGIWTNLIHTRKGDRAGYLYSVLTTEIIPQAEINEMIDYVWTVQEFPHQWRDEWAELWCMYQTPRIKQKLINRLFQQPRIIYRGGHRQGLSWTFDLEQARWFAKHRSFDGPCEVHQRLTHANEVKMIYSGREKEVVLDSQFWLYNVEI